MEKTYEVPNGIISVGTALVPSTMKSRRDSTSAKVFGEDWRFFFLVFPQYLPADVDLEGKVRRIRPTEST